MILEEAPDNAGDRLISNGTRGDLNAHLVEARKILCLSASDLGGIERQAGLLAEYLQRRPDPEFMNDLVYTLGQRRSMHKFKYAVQSDSVQGLQSSLEKVKYNPQNASGIKRLAFIFTGQGAQWPKMGCELLTAYPVFKDAFEAADKHMSSLGATWSLLGKF